jgi:hypothetical protein
VHRRGQERLAAFVVLFYEVQVPQIIERLRNYSIIRLERFFSDRQRASPFALGLLQIRQV